VVASLYFDNCFIPKENVTVVQADSKSMIQGFNVERIGNCNPARVAVGPMRSSWPKQHALTRKTIRPPAL